METFTKTPREPRSALAEAAGLTWLRQASTAVVEVLSADERQITTVRVEEVPPTPAAAREAGRQLAIIHSAGADSFGSPPPGWTGPNYIGTRQQECTPTDNWARFYVDQRVLPFAFAAYRRHHLSTPGLHTVQAACEHVLNMAVDVEPARLHGDLWAGNLLFGTEGPVLIDPAAHGGHPETDLAMLALFGAPFIEEIRRGYLGVVKLEGDWLRRTPMHQLHPLAVHALTHGPGYGVQLVRAAEATLRL
ncbi:fructosamine kinase family protein [Corynebacterium pacaense]|uniref:fructosamine kinase family protein n=1 Tax=Corynebacterium pacaense TaxID=1816684 RepID=UPI0009BAE965|nr:fructosamine kinase family protein [Corynebacterium pacaense]